MISLVLQALAAALAIAPFAAGSIEFVKPAPGAIFKGGRTISVKWRESGFYPELARLTRYDLSICAGGNTEDSYVCLFLRIA